MAQAAKPATDKSSPGRQTLIPLSLQHGVRKVPLSESREAGRSLAHSFAEDPLSQYLLDGDDDDGHATAAMLADECKWNLHVKLMVTITASHCLQGLVTTTGPDYDCVALWAPPGKETDDLWTLIRSGTWRLHYQLTTEGRKRYFHEMLPLLHKSMEQVMGDRVNECLYLVYIGTKPNSRGKGHAAVLLHEMMSKADAQGRPIYLESSSHKNNAFYMKFGFVVKGEIVFRRGKQPVYLYSMVREPVSLKMAASESVESSDSTRLG